MKNTINNIETSTYRLAQGNIFSLLVSTILGNRLADSQCGLKFSPIDFASEKSILQKPFKNQWLLDLEIMMRISKIRRINILEVTLNEWSHRKNSKMFLSDLPDIISSVICLRIRYGRITNVFITRS